MKTRILAALAAFTIALGLLVAVPVVSTPSTPPTAVAAAATSSSIYYRSSGGSMYLLYSRPVSMWYRLYPGDRVTGVVSWHPFPGFAATWYRAGESGTYTARCYTATGGCSDVPAYGDTIILNVYRL